MANRTRNNPILFYLSDDEKYILDSKVKIANQRSRSSLLRYLIIYGYVYDIDYSGLLDYEKQLHSIGVNINQIVRLCQKTGNVYKEDVEELKVLMDKVWETHLKMLEKQPLSDSSLN